MGLNALSSNELRALRVFAGLSARSRPTSRYIFSNLLSKGLVKEKKKDTYMITPLGYVYMQRNKNRLRRELNDR